MKQKILPVKISMGAQTAQEELSEIDKLKGRSAADVDHWGNAIIILAHVMAVMEYYPALDNPDFDKDEDDIAPDPTTCNVTFYNGLTWGVQVPYIEMVRIIEEYHNN